MTSTSGHRRRDVSRVEGFSDAVFGFAITLLVVSLEVPKTFHELLTMMRGLPAFGASFAMLFQIWWRHYSFFRRYDLEDSRVIALTGALLFFVLFYVYPLKFLWSLLFAPLQSEGRQAAAISAQEVPILFAAYGIGVMAISGILAALYSHAYRCREQLELTAVEIIRTRFDIYRNLAWTAIGFSSIVVALILSVMAPKLVGLSGFVYFAIAASEWILGSYEGRQIRQQQESPQTALVAS